jgi:hypothetical protein
MTNDTLKTWFADHWIELVIVGGILFLSHTLFFDVRDRLARTESLNETTSKRLDRIADAIPSVTIKIASEFKYKPVEGVVLVSKPELKNASWTTDAKIIDTQLGTMTTIKFALENQNDQRSIADIDNNAVKIDYLNELAKDGTLESFMATSTLQENSSFVYVSDTGELVRALINAGAATDSTVQIPKGQMTWDELVRKIEAGQIPTIPPQK